MHFFQFLDLFLWKHLPEIIHIYHGTLRFLIGVWRPQCYLALLLFLWVVHLTFSSPSWSGDASSLRIWSSSMNQLYEQTVLALRDVLYDSARPFCSHYGAVMGLIALGPQVSHANIATTLNHFSHTQWVTLAITLCPLSSVWSSS